MLPIYLGDCVLLIAFLVIALSLFYFNDRIKTNLVDIHAVMKMLLKKLTYFFYIIM